MSQQINDNFQLLAGLPIDDRIKKPTISERDAISSTRRFQGLQCFVEQTQTLYMLIGGISNTDWKGIAGADTSNDIETIIEGFYVLLAGKETPLDWEVGDKFRGWIGGRYVVGEILSLPVSLPSDIDNTSKVHLAIDSDNISNISTDEVTNVSLVPGETATDALNTLRNTKLNLVDAKQFGAVSDGITDDTAILQSYLNSGQGIYLFPKGNYSVSGLDVNSYSQLYFEEGAVLTLRDNSNRSVLQNKNFSVNTDKNIEIYGIEIEGNEANQIKNSVTPPYTGEPTVGLRFFGVENLKIIGAKINKARTYGIWLSRIKNGVFRDIEFNQSIATIDNQDGIHFNGLCYNLEISNIRGVTNDDMIALNADDVSQGSNVSFGEIKNVTIKDVIFNNNLNGIRLLSAGSLLDQIYINNLSGNIRDNVIAISSYALGTANFGSITIDGVTVDTNTPVNIMGDSGGYILINDKINYLKISNVFRKTGGDARPTYRIQGRADISKLIIENSTDVINASLTTYYPEISFESGSVLNEVFLNNIILLNGSNSNGFFIGSTGSSFQKMHINNIYADEIQYGLYFNNTDVQFLFVNGTRTTNIRYPFYLVNDSDINLAIISAQEWVYTGGSPGVYNILDTSSLNYAGGQVAQALLKYDDNLNIVPANLKEASGRILLNNPTDDTVTAFQVKGGISSTLATNGYAGYFEKTGGFGSALTLKTTSGSSTSLLRFLNSSGSVISDVSVNSTGLAFSSTLIASPAVLSTELVTKGQLDLVSIPYKIWVGVFQNNGTSAPTVTVNENTLGGTVVWTRSATGTYVGTLSGAFNITAGKTILGFGGGAGTTANGFFSSFGATSANTVEFRTYISGAVSDTVLNGYTWVEIRVYT